jgi:hypothetical protein
MSRPGLAILPQAPLPAAAAPTAPEAVSSAADGSAVKKSIEYFESLGKGAEPKQSLSIYT